MLCHSNDHVKVMVVAIGSILVYCVLFPHADPKTKSSSTSTLGEGWGSSPRRIGMPQALLP